jgi:hypothetical protein
VEQLTQKKHNTSISIKALLFACLSLLFCLKVIAQQKGAPMTVEVRGMVTENDKKLAGAVITIVEGGNTVNTINSSDGRFDFHLDQDKDYMISFSKSGYITKKISFSTKNIPEERGKYGFTPFTIEEVDIFPEIAGSDVDQILQQPVAKINYDQKYHNGDFNFDERYTESIQSILDKILAEKKALDAKYKATITKADGEFQKKSWEEAKVDYNGALKLKPNEQYPKDQLAAIEKALEEEKKKEAANAQNDAARRALEAKYDSVVKLADAAYNAVDYDKAKNQYNQALQILPDKKYPKDQLAAIEKALDAKKQAEENANKQKLQAAAGSKYDSIIRLADDAFQIKSFDNARNLYNQALQISPDKKYPKDQLAAIDRAEGAKKAMGDNLAKQKAADAIAQKYDSILKLADAAYLKRDYKNAKDLYTKASAVRADRKYPKDQIVLCDKALSAKKGALDAAAKQRKDDSDYDSIIKLADAAYQKPDYKNAIDLYNQASKIKPNKTYPNSQIALIEKLLNNQKSAGDKASRQKATQARYDSIIKIADAAFQKKDYDAAKDQYMAASGVMPFKTYPKDQIGAINRLQAALNKPKINYDSIAKAKHKKVDTAKPAPVVHIQVVPCNIKVESDSCKRYMKPFQYDGVNALHLPIKPEPQEKEINFPAFSGQRYRFIINLTAMPLGTTVTIYDQDNTHKKRKVLYAVGDSPHRINYFDVDCKGGKYFIDYEIPSGPPTECCAVLMYGYETKK